MAGAGGDNELPPECVARLSQGVRRSTGIAVPTCTATNKGKCWQQDSDDNEIVLDALDRQTSGITNVEIRRFRLQDVSTKQLDTLFNGCSEHFNALALQDCILHERFFSHATQRLATRGLEIAHLQLTRCKHAGLSTIVALTGAFLLPSLEVLELSSCGLARQAGIILSQSLQNCRALRRIVLANNNLRDGGVRAIADGLQALIASRSSSLASMLNSSLSPGLEFVDISCNGISATGLAALSCVKTQELIASDNAIDGLAISPSRVISAFFLDGGEVQDLDLRGNRLSADGIEELTRSAFHERSSLRKLNLSECELSIEAIVTLQNALLQSSRCPLTQLTVNQQTKINDDTDPIRCSSNLDTVTALSAMKKAVEAQHPQLRVSIETPINLRDQQQSLPVSSSTQAETRVTTLEPVALLPPESAHSNSPILDDTSGADPVQSLKIDLSDTTLQLRPADVEFIVSRTVESMNRTFDTRIGQFLARMETQQHEKASQLQFLLGKVEACERALPRLEARLDVLADRVAASGAQVAKLQSDVQTQMLTLRHELHIKIASTPPTPMLPTSSPLLSNVMQTQVDELVAIRIRASEQKTYGELQKLRREAAAATATATAAAAAASSSPLPSPCMSSSSTDSQAVLEAVSLHLSQFKRELDTSQDGVLREFTESIVRDGLRLEDRMARVEAQLANLEGVVQAEQQASLMALEAISEAFGDATGSNASPTVQQQQRRGR